jgi:hypothetical protein
MKSAECTLIATAPYSQSRNIDEEEHPKLPKESHDAAEKRRWRYRLHTTPDGRVEIPQTAFENAIRESVKRLQIPIPGKKMQMFTKAFEAGFSVTTGITTAILADDVRAERLFVPSDGRPGGGKRVWKYFPMIPHWEGTITCMIFDDVITEDVFRRAVESAGLLVGIGRFRPQNRGFYGRFRLDNMTWNNDVLGVTRT